jgi:replication-associated recombination protein RarA
MNNNLWIDKYRPTKTSEIKTHTDTIEFMRRMKQNKCISNLLCYGPAGCGKTTMVHAFGRLLYKNMYRINVMNINSSDERGVATIRNKIESFIETQSMFPSSDPSIPYKMVVFDEADNMTIDAQHAVNSIMDKYSGVRFVFICNYIYNIQKAIKSRCVTVNFGSIQYSGIKHIVTKIKKAERIDISNDAVKILCKITNNDLRCVIYILQTMNCSNKHITPMNIYNYLQYPTDNHLVRTFEINKSGSMNDCYKYLSEIIKEFGLTMKNIIQCLYDKVVENPKIPQELMNRFIAHFADLELDLTYDTTREITIAYMTAGIWMVRDYM